MGELERVRNAKQRREEFLEVTVFADGEDENSAMKTSKNYDIKIDDDEMMTFDGRATSSGINESVRKRTWQEIDGQVSASKSKRRSTRLTRRATWTWEPWR